MMICSLLDCTLYPEQRSLTEKINKNIHEAKLTHVDRRMANHVANIVHYKQPQLITERTSATQIAVWLIIEGSS